jgi:hypothetical protein
MNVHRQGVVNELMSIDQAARKLVVGVSRKTIIDEELSFRIQRFTITFHQAVYLGPSRFRSRNCVSASQPRDILSETVAGNEPMKIVPFQTESS